MADGANRDTLGMTQDELTAYFEDLLMQEAMEAARKNDTSVEAELDAPGFAAVRAAASYFIPLLVANNAFIARALLDRGVIPVTGEPAE